MKGFFKSIADKLSKIFDPVILYEKIAVWLNNEHEHISEKAKLRE